MENRRYLGDGLYASDDGFQFGLHAQRGSIEHEVFLDAPTMDAFLRFIEKSRGLKITATRNPEAEQ